MTWLLRIVGLLLLATLGAIGFRWLGRDPGVVIVALRGYSFEATLPVALVGIAVSLAVLWLLWQLLKLPFGQWQRYQHRLGRDRLAGGVLAALEGDRRRAVSLLNGAAEIEAFQVPALAAALDSCADSDHRAREALAARLQQAGGGHLVALDTAERALRAGDADRSARILEAAAAASTPRGAALLADARAAHGDFDGALNALTQARRGAFRSEAAFDERQGRWEIERLTTADNRTALETALAALPRPRRGAPEVVIAAARRAVAIGETDFARELLERSLREQPALRAQLAVDYARLESDDVGQRLRFAEAELAGVDDPACEYALGRLCAREGLSGKAEALLGRARDQALARGQHELAAAANAELGRLLRSEGRSEAALEAFDRAWQLVAGADAGPVRSGLSLVEGTAAPESRNAMGVPLPPME